MLVKLATLYEDGGRPLARHRAVSIRPSHEGILTLHEEHDRELRRNVRQARLVSATGSNDTLLSLYDAVVLYYEDGVMTITGMERDPITRKATAQSWYIEIDGVCKASKAAQEAAARLAATDLTP